MIKNAFLLIVLAFTNFALADSTSNVEKGFRIIPKAFTQAEMNLQENETIQLEGDICIINVNIKDSNKCLKVNNLLDQVKIKAFFPDSLHDVTSKLTLTQSKDKKTWHYKYKTDKLASANFNQFTIQVSDKDNDNKDLLSIKAKLEKRLQLLIEARDSYKKDKKKANNLTVINGLISTIQNVIAKINLKIEQSEYVFSELRLPLIVEGKQNGDFLYNSNFSGYKLSFKSKQGVYYNTEKPSFDISITNLSDKNLHFPECEDDDEDKNGLYDKYLGFKIDLDNTNLFTSDVIELKDGVSKTQSVTFGPLNYLNINLLKLSVFKINNKNAKNYNGQKLIGLLDFDVPVSSSNPPSSANKLPIAVLNCQSNGVYKLTCNATGSKDDDGLITKYSYVWDDGQTTDVFSSGELTHTFTSGGQHSVKLVVTDDKNESTSKFSSFNVKDNTLPIVDFTCTSDYLFYVNCTSTSKDLDSPEDILINYTWTFEDFTTAGSNLLIADHSFLSGGNKNITLMVEDSFGGKSSVTKSIYVKENQAPVASINCSTNNMLVSCNALGSYDPEGQNVSYEFNYSDGTIEVNTTGMSSHAYSTPGLYVASVKVTDVLGAFSTASTQVQPMLPPNKNPIASLDCNSPSPFKLTCNASGSSDSDGTIVNYKFIFDNGQIIDNGSQAIISQILSSAGPHSVTLVVYDNDGGTGLVTQSYNILDNTPPFANFTCIPNFLPQKIKCKSSSSDSDVGDSITSYSWSFGDNSEEVIAGQEVEYAYTNSGSYNVTLKVKDSFNSLTEKKLAFTIVDSDAPMIAFQFPNNKNFLKGSDLSFYATVSDNGNLNFDSLSLKINGTTLTSTYYTFDAQNNKVNFNSNISYLYNVGNNNISLEIKDIAGNTTSSSVNYVLVNNLVPVVTATPDNNFYFTSQNGEIVISVSNSSDIDWSTLSLKNNGSVIESTLYQRTSDQIILKVSSGDLLVDGPNAIYISITDKFGNLTEKTFNYILTPSELNFDFIPESQTAFEVVNGQVSIYPVSENTINWSTLKVYWNDTLIPNAQLSINDEKVIVPISLSEDFGNLKVEMQDVNGNLISGVSHYRLKDTTPPSFNFSIPNGEKFLNNNTPVFNASISDKSSINWSTLRVYLNDTIISNGNYQIDSNNNLITFKFNDNSKANVGSNTLRVILSDVENNQATQEINFEVVDNSGPSINYSPVAGTSFYSDILTVSATVTDISEINWNTLKLSLNNIPIPTLYYYVDGNNIVMNFNPEFSMELGANTVSVSVEDIWGNLTTASVNYNLLEKRAVMLGYGPDRGSHFKTSLASVNAYFNFPDTVNWNSVKFKINKQVISSQDFSKVNSNTIKVDFTGANSLVQGVNIFEVEYTDTDSNIISDSVTYFLDDKVNPSITTSIADGTLLPSQDLSLDFSISDLGGIDYSSLAILLNSSKVSASNYTFSGQSGTLKLKLSPGLSKIKISIKDKNGNTGFIENTYKVGDNIGPSYAFSPDNWGEFKDGQAESFKINITDESGVDANSIQVWLNNIQIPSGKLSWNNSGVLSVSLDNEIYFKGGNNIVKVRASDLFNHFSEKNVTYKYTDTTGPSISFVPVSNSTFTNINNPSIYFSVSDISSIDYSKMSVFVNNTQISSGDYLVDESLNKVQLNFNSTKLIGGENTIKVVLADSNGNQSTKIANYQVTDTFNPVVSYLPVAGTLFNNQSQAIKVHFEDISKLDWNSLVVSLNGIQVSSQSLIHAENDLNISTGSDLLFKQGNNTFLIKISDIFGNQVASSVTYIMDDIFPSEISFEPISGSTLNATTSTIKVSIFEEGTLNWNTLIVSLNGQILSASNYSITNNEINISPKGNLSLRKGLNQIKISIKDEKGNVGSSSASYLVNPIVPDINPPSIAISPASGSFTVSPDKIEITASDENGIDFTRVKGLLNGQEISSSHIQVDPINGKAIVTLDQTLKLSLGRNIFTFFVTDNNNVVSGKSVFYDLVQSLAVDTTPPVITFNPGGGELVSTTPTINVFLSDESGIDYNSVQLELNGASLASSLYSINQSTGKIAITFTSQNPLPEIASNIIKVTASDNRGNSTFVKVGFDQVAFEKYQVVSFASNISSAANVCMLLESGTVKCWGDNSLGQLGLGNTKSYLYTLPVNIPNINLNEKVSNVYNGNNFSCALTISGKVYCWGDNSSGQLGYGNTQNVGDNELPYNMGPVSIGEGEVKEMVMGLTHTCALFKSGDVKCWGLNNLGQLGRITSETIGDNELPSSISNINLGAKATQISAGKNHTCALLESGDVKCWGEGRGLGIKNSTNTLGKSPAELPIVSLNGKVKDLVSNPQAIHNCAILENDDLNCWGYNPQYAVGYKGYTTVGIAQFPSSLGVVSLGGKVEKVSVGFTNTCALLKDSSIRCWGGGTFQENGYTFTIGDDENPSDIAPFNYGSGVPFNVMAGFRTACIAFNDGTIKCWGTGNYGSLGQGDQVNIPASAVPTMNPINLGEKLITPINISAFFTSNPYYGPSPLLINFDASLAKSTLGTITNYHWTFGDGEIADTELSTIDHIFNQDGVYTTELVVTDTLGNTANFRRTITVGADNNPPFAFFNVANSYGVVPFTANFDASTSFDVNGTISKYSWNFGDNSTLETTTATTQHTYSQAGTYLAMLSVTDNGNATASAFPIPITVKELNMSPFANFDCDVVSRKINCFAYSSGDMDGTISNYKWDFGDAEVLEGTTKYESSHLFSGDGTYDVKLTIRDDSGAESSITKSIVIDSIAPNIISNVADNVLTNNPNFHLSVMIDEFNDSQTVISKNGTPFITTSDKIIETDLLLSEGLNVFEVDSVDGSGNKTHKTILTNVILDTIAPTIASINPLSGSEVNYQKVVITGSFSEKINSLLIENNPVQVLTDGKSFKYEYYAYTEGSHDIQIEASDLAGNSIFTSTNVNVQLKVLYPELISISALASGELKVTGAIGAVKANSEVVVSSSLLNRKTVTANSDGSFELTLSYFTSAKITATEPINGRSESAVLNYNVDTTLAGTIKDTEGNPLPNVKVYIKDTDAVPVTTNASGVFSFANPPTGDRSLIIDAQNVPVEAVGPNKKFSVLEVSVNIGSRQLNIIPTPIYLAPLLYDGTETTITQGVSVTVSNTQVDGAEIEIPGNVEITFPEGNTLNAINMAEVNKDRTTVPVPKNVEPQSVVALEPSGLTFSEPVKLTLPNVNEFPAGMQLLIYSKNSKTGMWEVDGLAKVDENGGKIVTQEGAGITHFSEVYAAPMGLKFSQLNSQDKVGADTFNGAVSTTIEFPGYKSLGSEIAPKLIYRSNWAYPTATVTNIFDIPNEVEFYNIEGKRIVRPSYNDLAYTKTWVVPDKIEVAIIAGDYHSPTMTVSGIPYKSVVSMGLDLHQQQSGILPFSAGYNIYLKRMVIRAMPETDGDKVKVDGNIFDYSFIIKENNPEISSEVQPASLTGNLYVQNKSNSSVGRGWEIAGVQRIINPGSSRIMLEEDTGAVSTYLVSDKIQTIVKGTEDVSGISSNDTGEVFATGGTSNNNLYSLDLDLGGKNNIGNVQDFTGSYGSTYFFRRHVCTAWTKDPFGGRDWCFAYGDRTYCQLKRKDYKVNNQKKFIAELPNGRVAVAFENGLIYFDDKTLLTGQLKNAPTSDTDLTFCNSTATCSNERIIGDFKTDKCPAAPASTGQVADQGYVDGALSVAKFNTIKSIASNPVTNGFAVADYGNNRIRYVNLDTNSVSTIAGNGKNDDTGSGGLALEASLVHPQGLAYDGSGNLYISSENGFVRKLDTSGRLTIVAGNPNGVFYDEALSTKMYLKSPYGLTYDGVKNYLYLADSGNNRVLRLNLNTGYAKTVAGNNLCQAESIDGEKGAALGASLCNPTNIALDGNKNLVIEDTGHKMIRRVIFSDLSSGVLNYDSIIADNSSLVRNIDGSFTRTLRSGVKVNFDKYGKHITTIDRLGRIIRNNYDSSNRLISQVDPIGGSIVYSYGLLGVLSKITYSVDGREFELNHNANLDLTSVTYPDGTSKSFNYNSKGLLESEIDQKSNSSQYVYNEWNRLSKVVRPDGKEIVINDSQSVSMVNNYTGGTTGALKQQGTNSDQLADGIKDAKGITTTFVSDESGYVSTIIDGKGQITLVVRDSKGRPVKITRPDTTIVEFTYDEKTGDLLSKFDSATDSTEQYQYDVYGNVLSSVDGLGRKVTNTFDDKGLLTKTTNETLGTSVFYTYNSIGQLLTQTDSMGNVSSIQYNERGNVLKSISADGKEINYSYFTTGLVNKVIDANNTSSLYEYDSMNRLISVTSGGNQKTEYTYEETGALSQTIDPYGRITNYDYDNLGQLIKKVGIKGDVTQLSYDENGNLTKEITPKGQSKFFYYDNLNQLVRKLLPDDVYNFEYDVRGNVTSVSNSLSKIDLEYEHFDGGDVISKSHSYGIGDGADLPNNLIQYGYNQMGERTSMVTPVGTFQYGRDSVGRLKTVTNNKGEIFSMSYDLNQRLKQITTPATNTVFNFDASGFNTQIQHTRKSGAIIDKVIYGRDDVGNRISKTTNAGTTSFEYDKNYQLIKATSPVLPVESMTYDSLGNRLSDSNSTYLYDETKQQIQEDYKYLYSFDQNGNMTSKQEKGFTGNVQNFDYNSENQLRYFRLYKNGVLAKEVQYLYDSIGRRIEKTIVDHEDSTKSYTKRFAYDGSEILFEMDGENNINKTYTHSTLRTDDVLSVATGSNSFFFLKDGLGTITDITDSNGFKVQHYEYTSFGQLAQVTDASGANIKANPVLDPYFTYTGREYDEETGLYYYRARYYDPALGRFLTVDLDPGKLLNSITHINKYIYTGNNPQNFTDPSGLRFLGDVSSIGMKALILQSPLIGGAVHLYKTNPKLLLRVAVGAVLVGGALVSGVWVPVVIGATVGGAYGYISSGGNIDKALKGAAIGAVGGAAAGLAVVAIGGAAGAGLSGAFLTGAASGFLGTTASNYVGNGKFDLKTSLAGAAVGGTFGMVGSGVSGSGWFSETTKTVVRVVGSMSGSITKGAVGNASDNSSVSSSGSSGGTTYIPSSP